LLELQDDRTRGIDDLDIVLFCYLVSLGRLSVGPKKHLHIMQLPKVVMVDGDESEFPQTFTLHAIVYDIISNE